MNQVTLLGHVGQDPTHNTLPNGQAVCDFTLATSQQWKDRQTGEKKEATEWHRVKAFGGLCEVIQGYVRKGTQVLIQGQLRTRKWQDQSGQDRYTTEIVLSGGKATLRLLGRPADHRNGTSAHASDRDGRASYTSAPPYDDLDDDIPF